MKPVIEFYWPTYKIKTHLDKESYAEYMRNETRAENVLNLEKISESNTQIIREKVANLPTGELAIVYLKFWEGLCEYEISKALGLSTISVNKILKSALARLKNNLTQTQEPECA